MNGVEAARERLHPGCFACSPDHGTGLHLNCEARPDGSVVARIVLDGRFEGYSGTVHGGVVATLLDSAMVQCLFAAGRAAVTGDLQVRFRNPLAVGVETEVRARVVDASPPLFRLQAEVRQQSRTVALGRGVFVERGRPEEAILETGPRTRQDAR